MSGGYAFVTPNVIFHRTEVKIMQEKKSTQFTQPEDTGQTAYQPPKITVYEEDELLKTVAVLGCSPF
jgi:hypothetical protein